MFSSHYKPTALNTQALGLNTSANVQPSMFGAAQPVQPYVFGAAQPEQPYVFGAAQPEQPYVFGAAQPEQPYVFGAAQSQVQPYVFGTVQPAVQPNMFGTVQPGVQPSMFGGANQNDSILYRLQQIDDKINMILNNQTNNYVVSNIHSHPLLETTCDKAGKEYINGFLCDVCNYKPSHKIEKFYHCETCYNRDKTLFDACIICIRRKLSE
jgi:hypothetical protein